MLRFFGIFLCYLGTHSHSPFLMHALAAATKCLVSFPPAPLWKPYCMSPLDVFFVCLGESSCQGTAGEQGNGL